MNDLSKKPTYEIISDLTRLEKEIDLKIVKYNLLIEEICSRYKILKNMEEFQPKVLSKSKYLEEEIK